MNKLTFCQVLKDLIDKGLRDEAISLQQCARLYDAYVSTKNSEDSFDKDHTRRCAIEAAVKEIRLNRKLIRECQ